MFVRNVGQISLCNKCHIKAEEWHSTNKQKFISGFHPNDLYALINSSYDLAFKKSNELER